MDDRERALERAHLHAIRWLKSLDERSVPASSGVDDVTRALGAELPEGPTDPADVVDLLATGCEPGLVAMPSSRFFGFVTGGGLPAALAADWLVSAWDQNCMLRQVTPAHTAVEDLAGAWLLDLLGLPGESAVGFSTGATMSNFTCLTAGRDEVLRRAGWDVAALGLAGGPHVRVVAGAERHTSVDLALRYAGLGAAELVASDEQGRIDASALATALASDRGRPTIVVLQAGNIHSGACDPFGPAIAAAHGAGAWVHVDGAFGLWAAVSPVSCHLTEGMAGADSWATDAHKTLNVPYDCGISIVRDAAALRQAMGIQTTYLIHDEQGDPLEKVPEMSRRGRAFPVWAALRSLGRSGVADLVGRLCRHAAAFADGLRAIPGVEVVNDVVFTQVCATFGSDERTVRVLQARLEDGTAWITGSNWHDRAVLRIAVSSWATSDADVERTLDAVRRVAATV